MIGLDTNILVRFVTHDDPAQAAVADRVMAARTTRDKGYVPQLVQAELWWVLRRAYSKSARDVTRFLAELLASDNLLFEKPEDLAWALDQTPAGADLADLLIAREVSRHADRTLTFDQQAASLGFGLVLPDQTSATAPAGQGG